MSQFIGRATAVWGSNEMAWIAARLLPPLPISPPQSGYVYFYDIGAGGVPYVVEDRGPVEMWEGYATRTPVPFQAPGIDLAYGSQDLVALTKAALAQGWMTPAELVARINAGNPDAQATLNPDASITFNAYSYDDEFGAEELLMMAGSAWVGYISGGFGISDLIGTTPAPSSPIDFVETYPGGGEYVPVDSFSPPSLPSAPPQMPPAITPDSPLYVPEPLPPFEAVPPWDVPNLPSPPSVPQTAANSNLINQVIKYGTGLFQMVTGSDSQGQPAIVPRQVGYVTPAGQPVFTLNNAGASVSPLMIAAIAVGAIAIAALARR